MDTNLIKYIKQGRLSKVSNNQIASGSLRFSPKLTIYEWIHRPIVRTYSRRKDGFKRNGSEDNGMYSIKHALKSLVSKYKIGGQSNLFLKWKTFIETYPKRKLYGKYLYKTVWRQIRYLDCTKQAFLIQE